VIVRIDKEYFMGLAFWGGIVVMAHGLIVYLCAKSREKKTNNEITLQKEKNMQKYGLKNFSIGVVLFFWGLYIGTL